MRLSRRVSGCSATDPAFPTVRGKAFDDRVGCTVLIGLLAERYPVDIIGLFSVQEEVGLAGCPRGGLPHRAGRGDRPGGQYL